MGASSVTRSRERPGDLAGEAAVLRVRRQRRALGVDHGHQRQPELGGETHSPTGLAQRLGAHRVVLGLAAAVLPEEDARRAPEAGQRDQQPRVGLALAGAVQRDDVLGGVAQEPAYAGAVLAPAAGDGVPGVHVGHRVLRGLGHLRQPLGPRVEHAEGAVEHVGDVLERQHGVDDAAGVEVLRGLHALGERLAVERLVDPRPEEADQRAGLGHGHVAQRAPGGHHPAGGGVAQVDEVGQPGLLVRGDGGGDPHHLHERRGALLHPGAAADGRREQRQVLGGGALDGRDQPVGGGAADRAGEEAELAHDDGDPASAHPPSPVSTDSSTPDFSAAAARSAAYSSLMPVRSGGVSHDVQEPSSRT